MPETRPQDGLNDNHRRAILAAFQTIDRLLGETEAATRSAASPFSRFFPDLSPTEQQVIGDYLTDIRGRMTQALAALEIPVRPPENPASWAIQTNLSFAQINVQEIAPSRLSGYGRLTEQAAAAIASLNADLERTLRRLQAYVAQGLGKDLAERLDRLEGAPLDLALLKTLERVIREHGLIEFHAALEALLARLETKNFEIAVFGRVSSGKSSLLNAVLGFDALPVGITPITAVPTRVTWGEKPEAQIRFATEPDLTVPLERLGEFVSETGNPENRKRVVRAVAKLPSPKLREGIVFVDTPGVGSLAASGARESYAYLPRCDLGILLVAATGAPGREDLDLLRLLYESGIPGMVVVSKADLLPEPDRNRMRDYVRGQITGRLGLDLPVHLVSVTDGAALARSWFEAEIAPLLAQSSELAAASARRKLAALREGVVASLEAMLAGQGRERAETGDGSEEVERLALEAEAILAEAMRQADRLSEQSRLLEEPTLSAAAGEIARRAAAGAELGAREILARALSDTSSSLREQIRKLFVSARDQLRAILDRMAAALDVPAPGAEEMSVDLVTLPALSAPSEIDRLELSGAGWTGRISRLTEKRVVKRLTEALGDSVRAAYESFGSELRRWVFTSEKDLANRFAASAEPLRARARRLREGAGRSDPEKIAAGLRELETAVPAAAAAAEPEKASG